MEHPEGGATHRAEGFLGRAAAGVVGGDELPARSDLHRLRRDPDVGGGGRAATALAARAVAVERDERRLGDLEADSAAEAAPRQRCGEWLTHHPEPTRRAEPV